MLSTTAAEDLDDCVAKTTTPDASGTETAPVCSVPARMGHRTAVRPLAWLCAAAILTPSFFPGRALAKRGAPQAARRGKSDAPAALLLAIDHFNAGRYADALSAIDTLGPAAATLPQAQFYAGYSHMRLGHDDEALARIEAALALTPDDLRAVYLRAVLRDRLNLPGASEDFARVRDGLPDTAIGRAAAEYLAGQAATAAAGATGAADTAETPAGDAAGAALDATQVAATSASGQAPDNQAAAGQVPTGQVPAGQAGKQAGADQGAPTSGDAATSGTRDAASASAPAPRPKSSAWRLRASFIGAYDSNPSYAADSYLQGGINNGPNGTNQIATSIPAAPEGTLWLRGEYAPAPWGDYALRIGVSGLARAYVMSVQQVTNAVPLQEGHEAGDDGALRLGPNATARSSAANYAAPSESTPGSAAHTARKNVNLKSGGTDDPPTTGTGTTGAATAVDVSVHDYDYDEVALDITGIVRPRDVDVRLGYRGSLAWLGYESYAHAHTAWSSVSWPRRAKYRFGLRVQADVFRPINQAYAFLRGEGGTLTPLFTAFFFDDDLLVEIAYALDGYDAANFNGTLGQFYSYTFIDHGPDLLVSYLAPFDIHLSAWGTLRLKSYIGIDQDPTVSTVGVQRNDTLILAGARIGQTWGRGFSGFVEFTYTRILSNVSFATHDGNLQRMLAAAGVAWE